MSPTRASTYRLLVDGYSIPQVADKLDRSRQCIHGHATELEKVEAIQRVEGSRSPLLFQRGPRARDFEDQLARQPPRDGGSSSRQPPREGARVHGGGYRWDVVGGELDEIPWAKTWTAKGVEHGVVKRVIGGRTITFHLVRGEDSRTLMVHPPEEFVADPDRLKRVRETRRQQVRDAAVQFARDHGLELQGTLEETQPTEIGLPVHDLEQVGQPGESAVWVDESEDAVGDSELETASPEIARRVMDLPARQASVDRRLANLSEKVGSAEDVDERLGGLESSVGRLVGAVEQLVERQDRVLDLAEEVLEEGSGRGELSGEGELESMEVV